MSRSDISNFRDDILEVADGEPIEAICIGAIGDYKMEQWGDVSPGLFQWNEVEALLNHEYNYGYGSANCPAIYAWTATKVIYVNEYDGSTSVTFVPRHPTDGPVEMS